MPQKLTVLAVLGRGVVDPLSPVVLADDSGLTRGDGCFEGLRVHRDAAGDGRVGELDAHLARMSRSAAALGLPFDRDEWAALANTAAREWAVRDATAAEAAMKLLLSRGSAGDQAPFGCASVWPMAAAAVRQRRDGVSVLSLARGYPSDAFADAPWLLGGVKLLSYAINMAAEREAARRGADDALFVSSDGYVLEAPRSSVLWWADGTLRSTPTGATGILAGTLQELLFERVTAAGGRAEYALATLADLHAADALWLASSVRGLVEVVRLDGRGRPRRPDLDAGLRAHVGF